MNAFAFSSRISGTQLVLEKFEGLVPKARAAMVDGLKTAAIRIHESAVKGMQNQSQGKRYGNHIASKPGDPPNIDTGRLVGSVKWEIDELSLTAVVGTNLDYGVFLEFGTMHMQPRPWLAPALRANQGLIARLFAFSGESP